MFFFLSLFLLFVFLFLSLFLGYFLGGVGGGCWGCPNWSYTDEGEIAKTFIWRHQKMRLVLIRFIFSPVIKYTDVILPGTYSSNGAFISSEHIIQKSKKRGPWSRRLKYILRQNGRSKWSMPENFTGNFIGLSEREAPFIYFWNY